jgi:hypothetical protein
MKAILGLAMVLVVCHGGQRKDREGKPTNQITLSFYAQDWQVRIDRDRASRDSVPTSGIIEAVTAIMEKQRFTLAGLLNLRVKDQSNRPWRVDKYIAIDVECLAKQVGEQRKTSHEAHITIGTDAEKIHKIGGNAAAVQATVEQFVKEHKRFKLSELQSLQIRARGGKVAVLKDIACIEVEFQRPEGWEFRFKPNEPDEK